MKVTEMSIDEMIEEIIRREKADLDAITVLKGNSQYKDDMDDIPITTRLEGALIFSGQAIRQESLIPGCEGPLDVSERVIDWAIKVLAKEKGGTEKAFAEIYAVLAKQKEQDQWHWLRQQLPDAAIESLIKRLESESNES